MFKDVPNNIIHIVETIKQPKCLLTIEWIKKLKSIYAIK